MLRVTIVAASASIATATARARATAIAGAMMMMLSSRFARRTARRRLLLLSRRILHVDLIAWFLRAWRVRLLVLLGLLRRLWLRLLWIGELILVVVTAIRVRP